ncbi:hypothetical protein ACFX2A_015301 [Malus domestica]
MEGCDLFSFELWPKPSDHALKPQMMVVSDLDDVFVPLPDDLLVNLSESRSVAESMFQDNTNLGGKLLIFQNTLPSLGVSRLKLCGDDLRVYGSDKEHPLRLLGDPFYKQMAAEFTKFQIEVDVYAFSDKGVRRCLLSDNQLLREAMTGGCNIRAIWILNSLDVVVFSRSSPNTFSRYPLSISIMGVQPCTFYLQNGQCKFGFTCKFDHRVQTMRYNLSASSLVDMPVVQYPVGFLLATLAPSSSSLDLWLLYLLDVLISLQQMWQLGLTSSESYPERPGVPNCVYYMRTGFFGYGGRCQYNHPRDRGAVVAVVRATGDYPVRVGGTCMSGMQ